MLLLPLLAVVVFFAVAQPAAAFDLAIQDQGADQQTLHRVADQLGAGTIRIIARPGEPNLAQVREARRSGRRVQAAIVVKRWTTAGDIRGLLRAWDGMVGTVSVGNEPELNGLSACQYARLFRRSYALIKREFPGVKVGIREASPFDVVGFTERMRFCEGGRDGDGQGRVRAAHRCAGGRGRAAARSAGRDRVGPARRGRVAHRSQGASRLLADFFAIHPYCPDGDPLAPCKTQFKDGYTGIGDLHKVKRYLRSRTTRRWLSRPNGSALPIRVTEMSYFAGRNRPEVQWPRALRQARKHAEQLVIYGLGPVHALSRWPSAAFLDAQGFGLPSLWSLARALGRDVRGFRRVFGPMTMEPPAPEHTLPAAPPMGDAAGDGPAVELPAEDVDEGGQSDEPAPETGPVPGGGDGDQPPLEPALPADPVTTTEGES